MKFYDDLTDQEIYDFVTKQRGISIEADIRRHRRLIVFIQMGIATHYCKKDIEWIRQWIIRLSQLKNRRPEWSTAPYRIQSPNNTPACLN